MAAGSKAFYCVNINNFTNNGTSSTNFARTLKAVKFTFTNVNNGANYDDLYDIGLNIDATYTADTTPVLTNCLYVNKVNGSESSNASSTKFYQQTTSSASNCKFPHAGCGSVADGTHHTILWVGSGDRINGDLGTGRINTSGKLYTAPDGMTYAKLGFDASIWNNTNSGSAANGMLNLI